jgi:hypothetical protein
MKIIENYFLKTEIINTINKYYKNTQIIEFDFYILKSEITKKLYNYIKKNISKNIKGKNTECLICYNTNYKYNYKIDCCGNQNICLECFSTMFILNDFKCLYCRKSIINKLYFDINKEIYIEIYSNEIKQFKFIKKKQKLINSLNKQYNFDNINFILSKEENKNLLKINGFNINNLIKIKLVNFNKFLIIWYKNNNNNITKTFLFTHDNNYYLQISTELYIILY